MKSKGIIAAALILSLAACAKDRAFAPGPNLQLVPSYELPPPEGAVDSQGRPQILIGPFDRIAVKVFRAPDFAGSYEVSGAGTITLPLVGTLRAEGETPDQLGAEIASRLRAEYLLDPQVSVEIERSNSQQVTLEGELKKPGVYPITGQSTLLASIAKAEGTTEYSKLSEVVVFRNVGTKRMAALYDLELIRLGTYPDPRVYGGDVIVVGDSPARRRFHDILTGSTLITTPIIALIQTL
jgi:polysaccharide export outer membrane protein